MTEKHIRMTLECREKCENCRRTVLILEYLKQFHTAANIISLELCENIVHLNCYKSVLVKVTVNAVLLMNKNEVQIYIQYWLGCQLIRFKNLSLRPFMLSSRPFEFAFSIMSLANIKASISPLIQKEVCDT